MQDPIQHLDTVESAVQFISLDKEKLFGSCSPLSSKFLDMYANHRTKAIIFTDETIGLTDDLRLMGRQIASLPDYRDGLGYMDDRSQIKLLRQTPNGWLFLQESDSLPVAAVISDF